MRIKTMKWVDERLGAWLCRALDPVARVQSCGEAGVREAAPVNIALVKFWGMGSIILLTPAIAQLRQRYPTARMTFITGQANLPILHHLDGIDAVLTLRVDGGLMVFLRSLFSLVVAVRRANFDHWYDFEFLTRFSALLSAVSGARWRAGFHQEEVYRGHFHHRRVPFNSQWHIVDNFCAVVSGELTPPAVIPDLQVFRASVEGRRALADLLREWGVHADESLVVLNPNAGELALERRWPVERFADLARGLTVAGPWRVLLIGTAEERDYVQRVCALMGADVAPLNVAGRMSLDQLIALFERTSLFITNDTGPLHLATAVGTPTVAIFGPETPTLFGPRAAHAHVVYQRLICSPCLNVFNGRSVQCRYDTNRCVTGIGVADVLLPALALLEREKSPVAITRQDLPLSPSS